MDIVIIMELELILIWIKHLYEQSRGTEKDIDCAFYWYSKAFENGCQDIKESLESLNSLLKQQKANKDKYAS